MLAGILASAAAGPAWTWVHLNLTDLRSRRWLARLDLPHTMTGIMGEADEHQQVNAGEGFLSGMIADRRLAFGNHAPLEAEEPGFVRFIVTGNLLLTGRHPALSSTEATRRILEAGTAPDTAGGVLMVLVEQIIETMAQRASRQGDWLDDAEDDILSGRLAGRRPNLVSIRRDSVRAKRQIAGLRSVLDRLEIQTVLQSPALREQIQEHSQRLEALAQGSEAAGERSRLLQEEISAALAERTNRHLHLLSILTALFLPATLVTGIFGMNTKDLPFTESAGGFWWALFLMLSSGVAVVLILRKLGVLGDGDQD